MVATLSAEQSRKAQQELRAHRGGVGKGAKVLGWRFVIGLAMLVKLALRNELFLAQGKRPETPAARVRVPLHDDPLHLGDAAVVAGGHDGRCHLRDCDGNGLALGCHQYNLLVDLNACLIPQQPYTALHPLEVCCRRTMPCTCY